MNEGLRPATKPSMRRALVLLALVTGGCATPRAAEVHAPVPAPSVEARGTAEDAPPPRGQAEAAPAQEGATPEPQAPELRPCVRTRSEGSLAKLSLPGVAHVDREGRIVRFDVFEENSTAPRLSYEYRWDGDRMIAERFPTGGWSVAIWDESGTWVKEVRGGSGAPLRTRTADGRWGIGGAPKVRVPPHSTLQPFSMPFSLDFDGHVRERGVMFDLDHEYEAGRLVMTEMREQSGGELAETMRYTWDDRDRLTGVHTVRAAREGEGTNLRIVWDEDRPVRIESLKRGRVRHIRKIELDDRGRLVRLRFVEDDTTFVVDYACDDVKPHHLLGGAPLL